MNATIMPRECEKWYNQRNILTSPCTITTSPCCLSLLFCQHLKEKSLLPLISKQWEPCRQKQKSPNATLAKPSATPDNTQSVRNKIIHKNHVFSVTSRFGRNKELVLTNKQKQFCKKLLFLRDTWEKCFLRYREPATQGQSRD